MRIISLMIRPIGKELSYRASSAVQLLICNCLLFHLLWCHVYLLIRDAALTLTLDLIDILILFSYIWLRQNDLLVGLYKLLSYIVQHEQRALRCMNLITLHQVAWLEHAGLWRCSLFLLLFACFKSGFVRTLSIYLVMIFLWGNLSHVFVAIMTMKHFVILCR